jgi:hypothetical protein
MASRPWTEHVATINATLRTPEDQVQQGVASAQLEEFKSAPDPDLRAGRIDVGQVELPELGLAALHLGATVDEARRDKR